MLAGIIRILSCIILISAVNALNIIPVSAADESDAPLNRREAGAILQELQKIRAILERIEKQGTGERRGEPVTARVSTKDRPTLGDKNASVTIVEYSDYQCPFCMQFVDGAMPEIMKHYIDTGKVRLVFKDLPLNIHQHALKAAQAAHCAGDQGKYWEMHHILFKNINHLQTNKLSEYAQQVKLNVRKFEECLSSDRHLTQIDKDMAEASQAGIRGTPTFIIGKTSADIVKGEIIRGAQPFQNFKLVIDRLLK